MHLVTILGNLLIILAISSDSHLYIHMYIFLWNISLTDMCLITSVIPMIYREPHKASSGGVSPSTEVPEKDLDAEALNQSMCPPLLRTDLLTVTCRFTNNMKFKNQTSVSEFLLLGLTDDPELQPLIFNLFLVIYLVTILGNLLIILAISSDSHLHIPMYFFLSNLSFTDICISTSAIPKMLVNIQTQDQRISYTGCFSQLCFVLVFGCLENFLLVVMAYDRYVAICHPLRYMVIMHPRLCVLLVLLSMLMSIVHGLLHSLVALPLSFCTNVNTTHFFCELAQIIKLACSDTFINAMLIYSAANAGNTFFGVPLIGIIFSYVKIVSCILRMPSVGGRYKAFSTCGSHLFVVSFFYGTAFGVYLSSTFSNSSNKNSVASVMYIVIPQVMNPFIYSLRNKEMKTALQRLITWKPFICRGHGL
ncbi:Olfactory receptor 7G1 [Heterocephalus glaber]|uniref:Olfactory receptor 7G1 n=1 Tax=Heterocephalus glaber TaxID=10181 RepID=G5BG51_HETGA|nr:Olfactory receptor 7G1 [Heterocephalus glaber]